MINKEQFLTILRKYREDNATEEEKALLDAYYNLFEVEPEVLELIQPDERVALKKDIESHLFARIDHFEKKPERKLNYIWWSAAAASIILILSFSAYFILSDNPHKVSKQLVMDANPGRNKAVLTLADGSKITLDDAKEGVLANQDGISVSKTADGQIVYHVASSMVNGGQQTSYNTLETPAGGQFQLILPDGSDVWLNAKSSIRFPTAFSASERRVEVRGEVYFEIEKDSQKPFRVVSTNQFIEVLGTHFNVNSYSDEHSTNTTLLEGKVKVSSGGDAQTVVLEPGQQSQLHNNNKFIIESGIDLEETIAWKNGVFQFDGTNLHAIMRQLARWYNVEVDISRMPQKEFYGVISRDVKLSQVLKMLELTSKLDFEIMQPDGGSNGRRIIMLK